MKITGIGFDSSNTKSYERYFTEKLAESIEGLELSETLPSSSEVLLINLTRTSGNELFGSVMPNENTYKIMVVHELYRTTIPFLKLADFVIYTNEYQRRLCEELLDLKYNSTVIPLPGGNFEYSRPERGDLLVFLDFPLTEESYEFYLKAVKEPFKKEKPITVNKTHFLCDCDSDELFSKLVSEGQKVSDSYEFYKTPSMSKSATQDIIQQCTHMQYLKNEMDFDMFDGFMSKRSSGMIHELIVDSPLLADATHAGLTPVDITDITAYNYSNGLKSTYSEWVNFLTDLIEKNYEQSLQEKQKHLDELEFDTLDDVIIEYGAPLSNDYVFSICFRNQEDKIQRCIESITSLDRNLDFGVVLVNDCSEDKSIEKIIESLTGSGVDACVVTNKKRNFAARNFYNVVNLYTTDDESVIIEVDGDDFLNGTDALNILDGYYQAGALKTNGSYKMYPDGQNFMGEEDVQRNHELMDYTSPWALDKCNAWLHLRTSKRKLIRAVEINHFLDRNTHSWLPNRHDAAIQPRIIELAEGKAVFVKEVIYNYDISGDNHDHDNDDWEEEHLKLYGHLSKIYHPLIITN